MHRKHHHHHRLICQSKYDLVPTLETLLPSRLTSPTGEHSPQGVEILPRCHSQHHVLQHLFAVCIVLIKTGTFSQPPGGCFQLISFTSSSTVPKPIVNRPEISPSLRHVVQHEGKHLEKVNMDRYLPSSYLKFIISGDSSSKLHRFPHQDQQCLKNETSDSKYSMFTL